MALVDDVRKNLRVTSTAYDTAEITPMIEACKLDLKIAGVSEAKITDTPDALVFRAIVLYCKANFGYEENAERF
jgi:hypothetical protein